MRLFASHISPTEDLIKRYHQPLYWHIRRMVVSHDDAQDVLQNTFLQVHLHYGELKDKQQERAWVYKVLICVRGALRSASAFFMWKSAECGIVI